MLLETGVLFNVILGGPRPGRSHLGLSAKGTPPNYVDSSLTSIVTVLPLSSVSYSLGTGGTIESLHGLVHRYEAWNKPDEAKKWCAKLQEAGVGEE